VRRLASGSFLRSRARFPGGYFRYVFREQLFVDNAEPSSVVTNFTAEPSAETSNVLNADPSSSSGNNADPSSVISTFNADPSSELKFFIADPSLVRTGLMPIRLT